MNYFLVTLKAKKKKKKLELKSEYLEHVYLLSQTSITATAIMNKLKTIKKIEKKSKKKFKVNYFK